MEKITPLKMYSAVVNCAYAFLKGEHRALFWMGVISLGVVWGWQWRQASSKKRGSNNFDDFVKGKDARIKKTDFSAFLKMDEEKEENEREEEKKKNEGEVEIIPEDAIFIPILYGTEFGFAKEIAEVLANDLKKMQPYWPQVLNMADFPHGLDLSCCPLVLLICSTQGDGVPPYEARRFCEFVFDGKTGDLHSTAFSVCALGDKSYAHFCQCGMKLRVSLLENGAHEFVHSVKVDKEDWHTIHNWKSDILSTLPSLNLTRDGTKIILDVSTQKPFAKSTSWSKDKPFSATVSDRWHLCQQIDASDRKTMHLEINIEGSGLTFLPGDAVGIYPQNCAKEVKGLISRLGMHHNLLVKRPPWTGSYQNPPKFISLNDALIHFYDLRFPKSSLFQFLEKYAGNEPSIQDNDVSRVHDSSLSIDKLNLLTKQKNALLLQPIKDSARREKYLSDRHVIDILKDFETSNLNLEKFLGCLRPLQPRLYSISSSHLNNPISLSITVAEVKYEAHNIQRKGVASTFLTERLKVGDALLVYVAPNPDFRLPLDIQRPILMIGPGTGFAPFRAFIQEKICMAQGGPIGQNLLFFGCRKRTLDYLYHKELESWAQDGTIELYTAFSREQKEKIYVQHHLKEASKKIWDVVSQGGHVYVCGDAKHMAPDVELSLLMIFAKEGKLTRNEASHLLEKMTKEGRYQRDVWF